MPGGSPAAWPHVKAIFQTIAAKVDDGAPCCDWVGENGAGHYVKMVHNGIEYGDMQLICEAYNLMKTGLGLSADEMHEVFAEWNKGELNSYLIEITRDILAFKDADGQPLVDKILDTAGQKGTGKWTVISSQDLGIPITLIAEAVYARCVSALKDERVAAAKKLKGPKPTIKGDHKKLIEDIRQALYASKIVSYAQGYMLMRAAAKEYKWNLNYGGIALMWRGGCIIRSVFLGKIKEAFDKNPKLANLLLDPFFRKAIKDSPALLAQRRRRSRPRRASRCRPSAPRWRSTTAIAANGCRPTCSRPSATTSARTPTSASTSRAASSSTPTGPATAAPPPRALTRCEDQKSEFRIQSGSRKSSPDRNIKPLSRPPDTFSPQGGERDGVRGTFTGTEGTSDNR